MTRVSTISLALCLSMAVFATRPVMAADPTTSDCLSANEASLTARSQNKLRDARTALLKCAAPSCPADVRDECIRGVNEINAALPTLVFEVKDATGADLIEVKVTMDGEPLADRLDGTALPVDPGAHTFSFEAAAGQAKVDKQLVVREGEKDRHERIAFGGPPAPAPPSRAAGTVLDSAPSGNASPSSRLGPQRIGAIAAAGVGLVGVALGIGFAADSSSKHDSAHAVCPQTQCPPGTNGVDLWNQAISAGNIATAAFVVGAVGLAAGAALWFTAKPKARRVETQLGLALGMLQIRGTW